MRGPKRPYTGKSRRPYTGKSRVCTHVQGLHSSARRVAARNVSARAAVLGLGFFAKSTTPYFCPLEAILVIGLCCGCRVSGSVARPKPDPRDAPLEKEPLHVAHVCSLAFVPFSTWRTCLVDAWFLPICCLLARVGREHRHVPRQAHVALWCGPRVEFEGWRTWFAS